jgi:hypothetical protein
MSRPNDEHVVFSGERAPMQLWVAEVGAQPHALMPSRPFRPATVTDLLRACIELGLLKWKKKARR